jgi:hypothetical protein
MSVAQLALAEWRSSIVNIRAIVVALTRQPRTVHCAKYPQASNWISAAISGQS